MGVSFERWLAKPSTACFLRRLIQSDTGCTARRNGYWQTRHQHHAAAMESQTEGAQDGTQEEGPTKQSYLLYKNRRTAGSIRGLYMSLRTASPLLPSDTEAKDVLREVDVQMDVGSENRHGQLVVDEPGHAQNLTLWAEILQTRQRLHGRDGLEAVWSGMRKRNVDLPTEGERADFFWTTFINGAIDVDDASDASRGALTLESIFVHAKDLRESTQQQYSGLYKSIVGRLLRVAPHLARLWHRRLIQNELAVPNDMVHVIPALLHRADAIMVVQRKFFRRAYEEASRRDLYDEVIAQALDTAPRRVILYLHQTFLAHGDTPSPEFSQTEGVRWLFKYERESPSLSQKERDTVQLKRRDPTLLAGARASMDQSLHPPLNREAMNAIVGDVHGIKAKELSDAFCARMFATRAFSSDWVIRGLALFGVDKLGPLALREMAVRAGTLENCRRDLATLHEVSIHCGDSVFSRLLRRIVKDENTELWQALLQSDQHPESYDDAYTQNSMLAYALEREDWAQVHMGLLTASLAGQYSSVHAWNRVLQYYMTKHDYPAVVSSLQYMKSQHLRLTLYTLDSLRLHVLPRRDPSKRPYKGQVPGIFEATTFVAKAYLYAAQHGTRARENHWVEVLKRLGMNHQWDELERVVLTLLEHAKPENESDDLVEDEDVRVERLKSIFQPNMRKALFVWSFRSASTRDLLRPVLAPQEDQPPPGEDISDEKPVLAEQWAKGLPLLQHLRASGFEFPVDDLRIIFVQRMWILFGPGYSTRAINHEARRVNRLSLAHYIRHANKLWNGLVNWVDPELLQTEGDHRLLLAFFSEYRSTSNRRREVADVRAWSEALASGKQFIIEPKRTRDKEALWMRSPLRFLYKPLEPLDTESGATPAATADDVQPKRTPSRKSKEQLADKD